MNITKVDLAKQKMPDGSLSNSVVLFFKEDKHIVTKRLKITSTLTDKKPLKSEATYLVAKSIREAERDFAYKKYGDKYIDHIKNIGSFWSDEITDAESELIKQAVILLWEQA